MIDKEKLREQLKKIYPEDTKLRDAVLFGIGVTEQLPVMNAALAEQLANVPADVFGTESWEEKTHVAVADIIRWSTSLEMSLHDLRGALFYRISNRIKKPLTEEQVARNKAKAEAKAEVAAAAAAPPAVLDGPTPDPSAGDPSVRAAKNISSLFKKLKK